MDSLAPTTPRSRQQLRTYLAQRRVQSQAFETALAAVEDLEEALQLLLVARAFLSAPPPFATELEGFLERRGGYRLLRADPGNQNQTPLAPTA